MTTFHTEKVKCAVCGAENDQHFMTSTSSYGSRDLDFRPPMVERDALWLKVSVCSGCGYASRDLSVSIESDAEHVRSEAYRAILKPGGEATLRGAFSAAAFLAEQAQSHAEAGWLHVFAAWASDDREAEADAKTERDAAIGCFERAKREQRAFCDDPIAETLLMADLCRRARRFDAAIAICREALRGDALGAAKRIIEFEALLCVSEDGECHTMAESMKEDGHES